MQPASNTEYLCPRPALTHTGRWPCSSARTANNAIIPLVAQSRHPSPWSVLHSPLLGRCHYGPILQMRTLRTERLIKKVPQLVSSTLGLKASVCFWGSPNLSPSGRVRIDKLPDQWVFSPEEVKKAAGRLGSHVSFLTWGCYSFSRLRGSRWALGHTAALQFFVLLTTWAQNAAGY